MHKNLTACNLCFRLRHPAHINALLICADCVAAAEARRLAAFDSWLVTGVYVAPTA